MSEKVLSGGAVPGWFGKLPNLGDFASRRLPAAFVRRWDQWLQRGLVAARRELGERWQATYLVAPVLRFWLAADVAGERGWAGLMMPSVDRAGRHFPLTLALPLEPLAAALAARDWFNALDRTARQVLDVEFTVDDFEDALSALAHESLAPPDAAAEALAAQWLLHGGYAKAATLWWCGDAAPDTPWRAYADLPPATAFVSLIGGAP